MNGGEANSRTKRDVAAIAHKAYKHRGTGKYWGVRGRVSLDVA